jgi:predicted nucleic acid-binding protein
VAIVLDASVTLAWCFRDEPSDYAERVLASLADEQAFAPSIWLLEVTNALLVAERRGRLSEADVVQVRDILTKLAIQVDESQMDEVLGQTLHLAREQGLSVYDASYLRLAMREGLPLATQDQRLRLAAERVGVPLFE